ncbi:polar amino acid transport system ATP-binding protein [ANME-1 cluster archaeon GoMg3.2]|nr:polar amino acid transport system ATP-binding protein [ANME-1 cluster archaeon GoMg3.2]
MPSIELKSVSNYVFSNLNMEIFDGELLVVLGSNGAGKTTLLNIIAGLAKYTGAVLFDGVPVDKTPVNERQIGYIFQNLALFPHLDVASNVGYSLMIKGKEEGEIIQKVDELLQLTKIEHLKHRYPKNLSGGEKQRVALARALASSPKVLLLDEPFNSLDIGMCECLRKEIRQVQREMGITTVFVTHNLADVAEMGDRVVALNNGKIWLMPPEMFKKEGDNGSHSHQDCLHCVMDCYCKGKEGDYESTDSPTHRM